MTSSADLINHSVDDSDSRGVSGFLFLADCDVSVIVNSGSLTWETDSTQDSSRAIAKVLDQWLQIELPGRDPAPVMDGSSKRRVDASTCSHCRLALHLQTKNPNERIERCSVSGAWPQFDGTIQGAKPDSAVCKCEQKLHQRTDGALLLGLALTCQHLGHVSVRSIQVLLRGESHVAQREAKAEVPSADKWRSPVCTKVALVITLSIPETTMSADTGARSPTKRQSSSRTVQNETGRRCFISCSSKPLPPATQLLLSQIRNDWATLDYVLQRPESVDQLTRCRKSCQHRRIVPFFPSKLSLEEIYQRIGGAAGAPLGQKFNMESQSSPSVGLSRLPKDVLQDHVASYLKAKSLDALRCTNKHLQIILQGVVPGLKLRLYTHQINSLSWMRVRETKAITENEMIITEGSSDISGDPHRAASGGATVSLRPSSRSAIKPDESNIRLSQYNGREVIFRADDPLSRSVARGGLLCDDPGLGKTVTVISLILQTLGLSTAALEDGISSDTNAVSQEKTAEERIFDEYWREQSIPQLRCQAMNKLLSSFLRTSPEADIFLPPINPELDEVPDYFDVIPNPICIKDIQNQINELKYDQAFDSFQSDVLLCFRNAKTYHPSDHGIHQSAMRLENTFLDMVLGFKQQQIRIAKKSFARAASKPNSSVAALVEQTNHAKLKNSLVPSSGTLLVVPSVLLEHWQEQLRLHVDMAYCTTKPPIIFEYSGTTENRAQLEHITRQSQVDKTHAPFLFVDKTGTRKLPSPKFLAMFSLVLTTNHRFTNEWKNGSFEEELRHEETNVYEKQTEYDLRSCLASDEEACPLLKVNWLRMIVDEGHSMGRGQENSAILFASWVIAERRWAMTGTPTRQTVSQSGLSSILYLIRYLQHDFFSRRQDGDSVWRNLIAIGWSKGMMCSFFRLKSLLSLLMVRHTKGDIQELPPPGYRSTILPMSTEETKTYNTLVCAVQSNLLITSMKGKTSGLQDSLLHRSQARFARDALRNIRLVCSGGTQVVPTVSEQYLYEFLRDFEICNSDPALKDKMKLYLSMATTERVSPCDCCGTLLTTQLVFPCGDLVCTECVDPESSTCIVCNREFDVDVFQRLQPGMDYQWLHNIEQEAKSKKPVAHIFAGPESSVERMGVLEGGRGVLAPLDSTQQRRRTARPGDGHECEYDIKRNNGECILCWKEHDACNLMVPDNRCRKCHRSAEPCPGFETKPFYVVQKLLRLYEEQQRQRTLSSSSINFPGGRLPTANRRRPLKAIVFSQFRKVLNTTGDRLLRRFGTACIAEYWGQYRKQELHKFIYDEQCFCMLLGKDGSEGLDLSFVTNIIFLEQVWDKSLEQQVVARAWRMGAQGIVEVETLIAENSVEETMSFLETTLDHSTEQISAEMQGIQSATESGKASDYQRAKLQFLLKGLRLVTSSATNPLSVSQQAGNKRSFPTSITYAQPVVDDSLTKRGRVKFSKEF